MTQVLAPVGIGSNTGEAVALSDGGYMVVWTHLVNSVSPISGVSDDQFEAVLGRTFNADGTPRGEVFQINQSNAASGQTKADVDVLSNGNVVVVWQDGPSFDLNNIGAVDAYGRVFTAAGVPVTDEVQLSSNTQNDQRSPKVVADDRDGFIAVWADGADPFSNTDAAVMAQRFDATANKIGPEVYVDRFEDQDMELIHVREGVITVAGASTNKTIDIDESYEWYSGVQTSKRIGVGGEGNYASGFKFNDDAVDNGKGGYVAVISGALAPTLTFWSAQEVPNTQTSNYADGSPPTETITGMYRDGAAVLYETQLTFNGEDRPAGVDFYPVFSDRSAAAATVLENGDIVVAWTAVSGGTQDVPEFSLFAATVSGEGIILSDTTLIAADVQGSSLAPPFITSGANDQVFIGWTGTTDRNGAGTNEIIGGTFNVPRNDLAGQIVGTNDADVITGMAGTEQSIFLRDGDDTFYQGDLTGYDTFIYGMGGDDLFVMTDGGLARNIIAGSGYNTLDLSTATTGQNISLWAEGSHVDTQDTNPQFGAIIGSVYSDTIYAPRVHPLFNGAFDEIEKAYLHTEAGDDNITLFGDTHGGELDGGEGFDVIRSYTSSEDWELTFEGDHYTLGYLYQEYLSTQAPAVRDGYLLELRSIEEIRFTDQVIALQATQTRESGAIGNATGPMNTAPVAVTDVYEVDLNDVLVIPFADLAENDTDADGDALSIDSVNVQASGGRAEVVLDYTSPTGDVTSGYSVVYTPTEAALGLETLTYEVSDPNGGTTQGTIEITSSQTVPVNEAPITEDDTAETAFATAITVPLADLISNDSDPDGDGLSISAVTSATKGLATINANGGIDFAPMATFSGTTQIEYTVSDGNGGTAQSTLSIAVGAPDNSGGSVDVAFGTDDDNYTGSTSADTIDGGAGFDTLNGGDGDDVITDAMGAVIDGGNGRDTATAQAGNNTFNDTGVVADQTSTAIDDVYRGGFGNDNMSGGQGNDVLIGDNESLFFFGADTLDGGIGIDFLSGGFDADVFYFEVADSTSDGAIGSAIMGSDVIGTLSKAAIDAELSEANPDITNIQSQAEKDFEIGIDIVQLAGFSAALQTSIQTDLSTFLSDTAGGVEFEAAGVRILFADIDAADMLAASVADVFAFV